MKNRFRSGMTLMEILVTFSLIACLAVATFALLRPEEQFAKAKDVRRKNDLNELRKVLESWLGDYGCYPKLNQICYNTVGPTFCNICTSNPASPSIKTYTTSVLCDPDSPNRNYLYNAQGDPNCPTAYAIYSKLTASYNPANDIYHCTQFHACGPAPFYGYDYMVTSPNAAMSVSGNFFCIASDNTCSSCGTFDSCTSSQADGTCGTIYPSTAACCSANPGAGYCS